MRGCHPELRNSAFGTGIDLLLGGTVPNALLLNSIRQVLYVDETGSVLAADRSDPYRMLYEHMKPDSTGDKPGAAIDSGSSPGFGSACSAVLGQGTAPVASDG